MTTRFLSFLLAVVLAGCGNFTVFPVDSETQARKAPENVRVVRLSASNINDYYRPQVNYTRTAMPPDTDWEYVIGVGDVLNIVVFDHPELTLPGGGVTTVVTPGSGASLRGNPVTGFRVQADGTFFYPFIGQVKASGRTIQDVRQEVSQKLAAYITDPQVEARIEQFNSQSVVVSGEVNSPTQIPLQTVPLTLLEAVNVAGGWTDLADTAGITIRRKGRKFTVDLDAFLEANAPNNNPILRAGDVVHVPERRTLEAFVLGEVNRSAPVDLSIQPVSLTEALTDQGGLRQIRADARGVFVFRQNGQYTDVYQLVTTAPDGWLLGTRFTLQPQDVIYVTRSPLQTWNDTISLVLPSVNAFLTLERLTN